MSNKIECMIREVAVHVNNVQEGEQFLKAADLYGFSSRSGLAGTAYGIYGPQTCLLLGFDGKITYCNYDWFKNRDYIIVEWNDYAIADIINMTGINADKEIETLLIKQHRKIRDLEKQLREERLAYDLLLIRYNEED